LFKLGVEMTKRSQWPFWSHQVGTREVSFTLDGDQASALAAELRSLAEREPLPRRVDELLYRLTFDADHLKDRKPRISRVL